MTLRPLTPEAKKRWRERSSKEVLLFLSNAYPEMLDAEKHAVIDRLSDERLAEIAGIIWRDATEYSLRYGARVCALHGWFLDMEFPAASSWHIAEWYDAGDVERADWILGAYYRKRTVLIRTELTEAYPQRAILIRKAFRAHFARDYDISVPLLLIQADGICKATFGVHFFEIRGKALKAKKAVDKRKVDWTWNAWVEPFRIPLPIAVYRRSANFLHRHLVLHGESLNYGTEINSLKAISLVSFLHGIDSYAREKEHREIETETAIQDLIEKVTGKSA